MWLLRYKLHKSVTTAARPLILTFLCYSQRDKRALPRPLVITLSGQFSIFSIDYVSPAITTESRNSGLSQQQQQMLKNPGSQQVTG